MASHMASDGDAGSVSTEPDDRDTHDTLLSMERFFDSAALQGEPLPSLEEPRLGSWQWPCESWAPFPPSPSKQRSEAWPSLADVEVQASVPNFPESGDGASQETVAARGTGSEKPGTAPRAVPILQDAVDIPADTTPQKPRLTRKPWATDEEERFLKALKHFGPEEIEKHPVTGRVSVRLGPGVAEMISMVVRSRSVAQVRSHVQKHYIRLEREASRRCLALQVPTCL